MKENILSPFFDYLFWIIYLQTRVISQLPDKISKIPLVTFFDLDMKSLYAKFQLSSFKTEGGVWSDRQTERRRTAPLYKQDLPQGKF